MCYSIEFERDIEKTAQKYKAIISSKTKKFFEKNISSDDRLRRVFKNGHAPAIIWRNDRRELVSLRFNLLPHFSETDKYQFFNANKNKMEELSTYNARIEGLFTTKAYKFLIGKKHCLVPAKSFFEWGKVKRENVEVRFEQEEADLLLAGLWDHWGGKNELGINSFAIITTPAREEVEKFGHHRSPLILNKQSIDSWIAPSDDYQKYLEQDDQVYLVGEEYKKRGV